MPRKTLALISGLVLVTVILFFIALKSGQQAQPGQKGQQPPVKESMAHSVLSMSPNPVTALSGQISTVSVDIDTSDNPVTAVQLEIMYDPKMVSSMKVTPGPLFKNAVVLINKDNAQTGRYTYAFGIQPNQQTVTGTGQVAEITFVPRGSNGAHSQLTLLPSSLVTARGVATSVLKMGSGTTVMIGNPKAATDNSGSKGAGY